MSVVKGTLDLCLFLAGRLHPHLNGLRIATGGPERARLGLEEVRHAGGEYLAGEARTLEDMLLDARIASIRRLSGERRVEIVFESEERCSLVAECFGPKGNWFLLDPDGVIRALARRAKGARADLATGERYRAPEPARQTGEETPSTPGDPMAWLESQAARFARIDLRLATDRAAKELARDLRRERKSLAARMRRLEARQAAERGSAALRREAELLLAQPNVKERGRATLEVSDWYAGGKRRIIELDPKRTVRENAERRFDRAKRLEQGARHTATRMAAAREREDELGAIAQRLAAARAADDLEALDALQRLLAPRKPPQRPAPRQRPAARKPYLAFTSSEGYPIWVGRTRADNDTLTLRLARGNDVWLHAAGSLAGSHVVIRLERGKTASLESLLDAATLALHFSKARGRPRGEVLYTQRKHVRKPKGLPPGQVEVLRSKTLQVRVEPGRLRRLLGRGGEGAGE